MTQPQDPNQPEHQQPTEKFDAPETTAFPPPHEPVGFPPPYETAAFPPPTAGQSGTPAQQPAQRTSWFSGTRRTAIVTGVAGLVVGGVIGGSIGWATTGNDSPHTNSAYSRQMSNADGPRAEAAPARRKTRGALAGTISAINGQTWTISGRGGRTVTVAIGQNTTFGTKKAPAQQSDFRVGDRIAVVGKAVSGTVDATRVAKRTAPASASTQPSASATPGATSQPS